MKHKEQILFCLKLQEENYEANRNVEIFEDNNSRNRNPVSCVGGMVYAFGTEAGAGGAGGKGIYWGTCIFIWITAVPCFVCLVKFWGICSRIGENRSFCRENAEALRQMSHCTLADSVLYALFLGAFCILGWYSLGIGYLFGIVLILFICITLTVLCAALSHLVYNASQIQEDQDLTI